ncbi:hypothetical protein Syn8016DRAFT_1668 [Synechococcus sp. WH 8016]|nr:hypothetical protein Syn8016DRAFT_1668 [Synechococcus sp. WH 8016]
MLGFELLDFSEFLLVFALVGLFAMEILQAFRSRSFLQVYRPTIFVAVILSYYVLFAPLQSLALGEGLFYRGLDHRDVVIWGWLGALLFYGFLLLGFYFKTGLPRQRRATVHVSSERIYRLGNRLCQIGLLMFVLVTGWRVLALLNPFFANQYFESRSSETGIDVGGLSNYFLYSINLLIPGILLQVAALVKQRKHFWSVISWLFIASSVYISLGFRYRIVLLIVPIFLLWYLARLKRPNISILAIFLVGFILFNGFIGLTRTYGKGLDFSRLDQQLNLFSLTNTGVSETGVFLASSGVMAETPGPGSPFVGLQPLVAAVLFPIPRAIFPSKPDASYYQNALHSFYGGRVYIQGAVIINYAEYYLVAGFPSLILISFFLGLMLRKLWNWFLVRSGEPLAQCVYLLTASYLYVVVSRGYFPQVLFLFVFSVFPLFWLYRINSKPVNVIAVSSVLSDHSSLPRG